MDVAAKEAGEHASSNRQGALTRCSIRDIFQQKDILLSRCLESGGLAYLLLYFLDGFKAIAEERCPQNKMEKEKIRKS